MRQEINDFDIEKVAGGSVNISEKKNKIGFDTLGEGYTLKCSYSQARSFVSQAFAAHQDMTEKEFDTFIRDEFLSRGWI
ncbi:MAG: hypothetical protein IJJ23_04855 [Clostridia bacterium]|nr:hypothetical protein [Clostridia bacterium]